MTSETLVASALLDLVRAAKVVGTGWALVGGQALVAYGVPRETLDADVLAAPDALEGLAGALVETFGWTPLAFDEASQDYAPVAEMTVHYMDDPVLFDVHEERRMIPLRSPLGLPVEVLAAQHPVEREMIDRAAVRVHHGVPVPVAPLGGVLLVKAKADRSKDVAALEQAAEHLTAAEVREAVAWAEDRDAATAQDVRAALEAARARRVPVRTKPGRRGM
jgi:hypothetical protein